MVKLPCAHYLGIQGTAPNPFLSLRSRALHHSARRHPHSDPLFSSPRRPRLPVLSCPTRDAPRRWHTSPCNAALRARSTLCSVSGGRGDARNLFDGMSPRKMAKESSGSTGGDRIGDLPDEVLHHVLSFLPAQEAVRTCLLAPRWLHLWKSATGLRIGED
uniref:F-box domain-containing protein n=1 Tax=Oryza punctata TaxID=4537 RepID=A0A0E0MDL8_ORYPU